MMSAQAAAAEIESTRAAATADPKHPYRDPKHAGHKADHRRIFELQKVVTPGVVDGG